jgi:outer membrane protein
MKRLFIAFAVLLCMSFSHSASAQSKLGYVNLQDLVQAMPEYKAAETKLQGFAKQLQDTYTQMQDEYNKLVKEFQDNPTWPDAIKETKLQAITDLEKRMGKLEAGSEQQLMDKQVELLKPIQDKIMSTVKATAKESGYTYIFDVSQGSSLIYYPEGDNVQPLVRKKLGLQ